MARIQPRSFSDEIKDNPELYQSILTEASTPAPTPVEAAPAPTQPSAPVEPSMAPTEAPVPYSELVYPDSNKPLENIEAMRDQNIQRTVEQADSVRREQQTAEDLSKQRGQLAAEGQTEAKSELDAVAANHAETKLQKDKIKANIYADYAKRREPPEEPEVWQQTVSVMSRIVGALAMGWLGPVGSAVAIGMDAIDRKVKEDVYGHLEEQERAGKNLNDSFTTLKALSQDDDDEQDYGHKMVASRYLVNGKALEELARKERDAEKKRTLEVLASETLNKGGDIFIKGEQDKQARIDAQRKAQAAAANRKTDWSKYTPEQLTAFEASGKLEGAGIEYLNKLRKGVLDAKGKPSDGPAPAPVGRKVADQAVWDSIGDTEKAKYRTAEAALEAYNRDSNRLQALIKEHGTEAYGDVSKQMEAIEASMLGSFKDIKELGALDNGVIEVVERAHGDSTSMFRGGEGVLSKLKETQKSMNAGIEKKAQGLGLSTRAPAPEEDKRITSVGNFDTDKTKPTQAKPVHVPERKSLFPDAPPSEPAKPKPLSATDLLLQEQRRRQHQAYLASKNK